MDSTTTRGIWRRSVAGFVFASLFTLSDGDASSESTPAASAGPALGSENDSVQDDLVGDVPAKDTDAKKKQSKSSKIITKLIRRAQDQALDSNDAPRKKESKPVVRSTPDSVLDETSIAKKKTRKSRSRGVDLVDDLFDENTVEPRVKKARTRTRTRPAPRPVAGPEALDDSEAKPKPRTPRTPGVSPFSVKPPRLAVSADRPQFQPAPLVSTPSGAMPALSPPSAIYDRGTGLFLDLVNLATALTDARGEVELQRLDTTRFSELAGQNLVSEHEFLKAKILLDTAQRKADILKRMAETALRSSTNRLKQLVSEYEIETQRVRVGTAPQASLASIATRLSAAEGNVDILKTLLSSRPRKTAGRTSRGSGRATASGLGTTLQALGTTLQRIPTSLRIGIDRDGKLTLDRKGTDLERLSKTLQALVPPDARAACDIRLELESSCPLAKVTAVLARLENLEFSKVKLTTRSASKNTLPPGIVR